MTKIFHEGELAVQQRAGVSAQAQKAGRIIAPHLPHGADRFLAILPILFQGGVDAHGHAWASALTGDPGFIHVTDSQTVEVHLAAKHSDPLAQYTSHPTPAGFLAIDMATRQRFRFNGDATHSANNLHIKINQAYGNCPKYIQRREVAVNAPESAPLQKPGPSTSDTTLSKDDIDLIQRADTFFIASVASDHGADVSHRGGTPGFVRVTPQGEITFKDYAGNNMFQTLGNLTDDPRAGLLFINFETGSTLQLSGQAQVLWAAQPSDDFAETGRAVTFTTHQVVRTPHAVPLRWDFHGYSPYNPIEK
jgi:predicted pyridoxine 5'-phosphate oxidase superfamily flavin-nucleotide-binding protein